MHHRAMLMMMLLMPAVGGQSTIAGRSYQGEEVTCDLPAPEQMKNRGGRDGAGMCVLTSIEHAARWAGMREWRGLRDYVAEREAGGGWPEKVVQQLQSFAQAKGIRLPDYVQYEGDDPGAILALCDKTGRMASITYGYGPRYQGAINHMTNCVRFRGNFAVVLDNNFPGVESYEWMSGEELVRRICTAAGPGGRPQRSRAWVHVWLTPPPPPPPRN